MKKVNEMSNAELQQHKEVMEAIDSPEAKKLADEIRNELDKREAAAKAKRDAEEAKRKEEEAKREAEELNKELGLIEAQRSVIGKCYKKVFYDTNYLKPTVHYTAYYKVVGVYEDKAIVSFIKKYEYSEMVSKAITYININDLLDKNERYEVIPLKDYNDEYVKSKVSFESISNIFNRFFKDSVFF